MAFYRCDRGLGFDVSNSTGTENDVLYSKKFNNGKRLSGSIKSGIYSLHNIDVSDFDMFLKLQVLCNISTITNYSSINLSSNRYLSGSIRIPGTGTFNSNDYKNAIYGINGNSELKFINKTYKEILKIDQLYRDFQLYFEKSCIHIVPDFHDQYLILNECDNSKYYKLYNTCNISFETELFNQLCNIAQSQTNIAAIDEFYTINLNDINKIINNCDLYSLMSPAFVYKTQSGDIYLYHYYNNNANNIESTKLTLNFNTNYSSDYPNISKLFSDNKAFYMHEPYIKISNGGKIEHWPIIRTSPNSNIIFSGAKVYSFYADNVINDDGIYNIYTSLKGAYFRKYNLDYEIILETKINTDQFCFRPGSSGSSTTLSIESIFYYDNNMIFTNDQWYGGNIASLDYDGNVIAVLAFHYRDSGNNTRILRKLFRNDYIGIFTTDYEYDSYSNDLRIFNISYNYMIDNSLLSSYSTYSNLECLKYTELNPYNLDIIYSIKYDNRYAIPYNIKFGIRSYLGMDTYANNKTFRVKYSINSTKKPLMSSVYNSSMPYLVNIEDPRSMIIHMSDDDDYIILCYDYIYLLNDYDTNYNGYNIDSSNSNYTDYYFN